MKNTLLSRFLILILLGGSLTTLAQKTPRQERDRYEDEGGQNKRQEYEFLMTADPALGRIPQERLQQARLQTEAAVLRKFKSKSLKEAATNSAIPGVTWTERGPNNIGGRTRGLMYDPNDPTKKKVFAGSVAGGIWVNNDITTSSNWTKVNDFMENLAISCINYDPSNTQIFYATTGEGYYNLDAIQGGGIFKSTDGGATWALLPSTIPSSAGSATFQRVVVNSLGHVFASSNTGLRKSTDGGATWTTILGSGSFANDIEIDSEGTIYATLGRYSSTGFVYKSTDNGANWTNITPAVSGGQRVEIAVGPVVAGGTKPILYATAANSGGSVAWFQKSTDGGSTWTAVTVPVLPTGTPWYAGSQFPATQGWYNLYLAVNPSDGNQVIAVGVYLMGSTNGGSTWSIIGTPDFDFTLANSYHPDNHVLVYRPGTNEFSFGNDGGTYHATSFSTVLQRFNNYNVTQLISVAQKNIAGDNFIMGGSQDNGTNMITTAGLGGAIDDPVGGDGVTTFVDQDNPNIIITSYVYNNYYLLNGSGGYVAQISSSNTGSFYNPADYDSGNNTLFSNVGSSSFRRISGIGGARTTTTVTISPAVSGSVTHIKVAKTGTALFMGTSGGKVYKLTNTHSGATATSTQIGVFPGTISCVAIGSTDSQLLVTVSSYGQTSVWYTNDGGSNWTNKDDASHGLPDMPVRWAIFNPSNTQEVLLATELGVWSTSDVTATNPAWEPTNAGLANVCTYMLTYRAADGQVGVGTHGRGLYSGFPFAAAPACTAPTINSVTASPSAICAGGTVNLSANATGASAYSWAGPNGFSATTAAPAVINIQTTGAGIYTVTARTNTCTVTGTVSVSVNIAPTLSASNNGPLCAGSTLTLSATGTGSSYTWNGPLTFSSNDQNPSLGSSTTSMAGVYSVTAANVNGCSASATTSVVVGSSAVVSASNNGPVCSGFSIGLSATTNGSSFSWSGPLAFSSTVQNPTRTGATIAMSGVYSITVNLAGCTASATTSVLVNTGATLSVSNNGPVCNGQTLNLTATGDGVAFAWAGPSGFSSTQQNPSRTSATTAMSGIYTATATNSNGCIATATTSAVVNASLTLTASNNGPVCEGSTLNLSAVSNGTSFSWSGSSFSSTQQNPTIAGITMANAGIYTVIVGAGACTISATTSVSVKALPNLTASNNSPVCVGTTIRLSAVSNASTFAWSGPGGYSSTAQNPTRASSTTAMSGTYTARATSTNGCTASATTSVLVVSASVTASSNTPVCLGYIINLTATAAGASSFAWAGPAGFASTSQTPTRTNATTAMKGRYSVTAVFAGGCTASRTTSVSVRNGITITATSNSPRCVGTTLNLSSTITGGSSLTYNWAGPNGFTSTARNPAITNAQTNRSGIYTVTGSAGNIGCTASATTSVNVNSCPTAREAVDIAESGMEIQIAPNPTQGKVSVEVRLAEAAALQVQVMDLSGRELIRRSLTEISPKHTFELDLSPQPSGTYLLVAESRGKRLVTKVLKSE